MSCVVKQRGVGPDHRKVPGHLHQSGARLEDIHATKLLGDSLQGRLRVSTTNGGLILSCAAKTEGERWQALHIVIQREEENFVLFD